MGGSRSAASGSVRIARYMQPGDTCTLESAQRLADHLQVPLSYLFAETEPLAETILGFGLLPRRHQRLVVRLVRQLLYATGQQKQRR